MLRTMDDVKKANRRIETLDQRSDQDSNALRQMINQSVNTMIQIMDESNPRQKIFAELNSLAKLIDNLQKENVQLKEQLGNQQQQIRTLVESTNI